MTIDARWLLEWLAESAVRTTVLAAVVGLVIAILRIRSVDANRAVWRWVLVAGLVMPVLTAVVPTIGVPIWTAEAPLAVMTLPAQESAVPQMPTQFAAPSQFAAPLGVEPSWELVLLTLYGLVAVGLLLRLAVGCGRISRLRLQAQPAQADALTPGQVRIVESDGCRVPFTFGWLDPTVVLPSNWQRWSQSQLGVVLTHEFAHIENRDFLFQMLSAVHRCLFWFSPLSWWLDRRLAGLAEHAGDDAVLRAGHDAVEYADWLYQFFGRRGYGRWGTSLVSMAGNSPAALRIDRILDPTRRPSRPLSRRALIALALLFLPLLWLSAGSSAVARAASSAAGQLQPPATPPNPPLPPTQEPRTGSKAAPTPLPRPAPLGASQEKP